MRHRAPLPGRLRPALAAMAVVLAAGTAAPAFAQDPPDTIPAGAKREIRDLRYVVQDLAVRIDDLRVNETDLEIRLELAADVLFDFDKAVIRPAGERALGEAARIILERAVGPVRVEGHTDAKGTDAYNQRLSERRAEAVKTWLVKAGGVRAAAIATKGFGAKRPVASNTKPDGSDDPDGRQRNRRVEIIVQKKG